MADSLKRVEWAKSAQNKDRCRFYAFQKAQSVLLAEKAEPGSQNADELTYAREVFGGGGEMETVAMIVAQNETIGAAIDAGNAVLEGSMQWVIFTDQWNNIATAFAAQQG